MITPEESQKILDLRQRMLTNIQCGRPSQDGITADELREALTAVRKNRSVPATNGGKTKKASTKKPPVVVDTKAFTDIDLD